MSIAYLAQDGEHQQLEWLEGSVLQVLFDGAATQGQLAMFRGRYSKGAASPVHAHANEDEMFVVLAGEGVFWVGDERHVVGAGGSIFLPRNVPHAYRLTSERVDMLTICTPAGAEGFFREAGRDLSLPRPDGWAMTPDAMAEAASHHGLTILGPPPAGV